MRRPMAPPRGSNPPAMTPRPVMTRPAPVPEEDEEESSDESLAASALASLPFEQVESNYDYDDDSVSEGPQSVKSGKSSRSTRSISIKL